MAAVGLSLACFLDKSSSNSFYFNSTMILERHQYYRIFSSFLFFGQFGLSFFFSLLFFVRYCSYLEEGRFHSRRADMIVMLIFGAIAMIVATLLCKYFTTIVFFGTSLSMMIMYIWSKAPENADVLLAMFGVVRLTAPYLPWMILLLNFLFGDFRSHLLGIIVGHCYYFLDEIYPQVARIRGWRWKEILVAPWPLKYLCNELPTN